MKKVIYVFVFFAAILTFDTYGQKYSEAIEDNSFFIEEAFNQEENVIQHIFTGNYFRDTKNMAYSFTQEWPFLSQSHQLSFTASYFNIKESNSNGFGDLLINYRYQLFNSDDWAAFSPRFSVIIPTGDENKGLGTGVWGVQLNMPFSKRISEYFFAHANFGTTILPNVKFMNSMGNEDKSTLISYYTGFSVIFLAHKNFNLMLEYVYNYSQGFDAKGEKQYTSQGILSPGARYAIDIKELQIVPGLAIPTTFINNEQKTDLFFYLSFEHPI